MIPSPLSRGSDMGHPLHPKLETNMIQVFGARSFEGPREEIYASSLYGRKGFDMSLKKMHVDG